MGQAPPPEIAAKYLESVGRVTRRIEIYEQDGKTPWAQFDTTGKYLIDGNVSVDYDRAERRSLDLTLDNDSRLFDSKPTGFWYDKVIKVFRGLEVNQKAKQPKIAVVGDAENEFLDMRTALLPGGYTDIRYVTTVLTVSALIGFDIVIFNDGPNLPVNDTLVQDAYNAGINILTIGAQGSSGFYPQIFGATRDTLAVGTHTIKPYRTEVPAITGWSTWNYTAPVATYTPGGTLPTYVKRFGTKNTVAPFGAMAVARQDPLNKRWIHLAAAGQIGVAGFNAMMRSSIRWLNPVQQLDKWEIQIGEFMIDSIKESHFPHNTVITGRDYAKKLILSTFPASTQFASNATAEATIKTIVTNAGIDTNRIILPNTSTVLGSSFIFERGSTRWDAIKTLATAYNFEVFFDNAGNFVLRAFQDPTTDAVKVKFNTGVNGNLVSYDKSANDTSIFNHIVVAGESSDSTTIPKWAEAINTKVGSPTSVANLGDRTYTYTSPLLTTTAQCLALAKQYLAIYALEEYQMDWNAICIDWLEAGDVVEVVPDRLVAGSPTRFLLTSFSLPLTLAPMSGTGRRMLIVA
jgi:hypothetical protein